VSLSRGERYADAARFVSGLSFADDEGYDWKASMAGFRWGRRILEGVRICPGQSLRTFELGSDVAPVGLDLVVARPVA